MKQLNQVLESTGLMALIAVIASMNLKIAGGFICYFTLVALLKKPKKSTKSQEQESFDYE
ncbi:hypothetical protein NY11_04495 [Listeria monocytogenes]|nr:hypothetical protein [Listeria monocytogenes]